MDYSVETLPTPQNPQSLLTTQLCGCASRLNAKDKKEILDKPPANANSAIKKAYQELTRSIIARTGLLQEIEQTTKKYDDEKRRAVNGLKERLVVADDRVHKRAERYSHLRQCGKKELSGWEENDLPWQVNAASGS